MKRDNIAIIGSGPAGISAALTAKARNQDILLFGRTGVSEKISRAHGVRNYPGLPDISGENFAKAMQDHLEAMDIPVCKEQVTNIYAMGDYYAIQTPVDMYEADTIILATGAVQGNTFPGEEKYLGKGVSYCATCDAFFYRDKKVAVIGYREESADEAEFLAETSSKVYFLPVGFKPDFSHDNIEVISGKVTEIAGDEKVTELKTTEGEYPVDGIFILRDAENPATLVPGLDVRDGHVTVNLQMETNLPGLFAAGDIAGRPYQYVKAAGQGNVAALSAVDYLIKKRRENQTGNVTRSQN